MKQDTILTLGLLGIGGYAAYRLLSPIEDTAKQIGGGIGTAFEETGGAKTLFIDSKSSSKGKKCIICNKPAEYLVYTGKTY